MTDFVFGFICGGLALAIGQILADVLKRWIASTKKLPEPVCEGPKSDLEIARRNLFNFEIGHRAYPIFGMTHSEIEERELWIQETRQKLEAEVDRLRRIG